MDRVGNAGPPLASEKYCKPDWPPSICFADRQSRRWIPDRFSTCWWGQRVVTQWASSAPNFPARRTTSVFPNARRRFIRCRRSCNHWRMVPGSPASEVDAKPEALEAGRRALEDHVRGNPGRRTSNPACSKDCCACVIGSKKIRWLRDSAGAPLPSTDAELSIFWTI